MAVTAQARQVEDDLGTIFGGNFSPNALGDEYMRILQRLGAAPAAIFDAVTFGRDPVLLGRIGQCCLLLASPGEPLTTELRSGDLIVRRAMGEPGPGHVFAVVDGTLLRRDELPQRGLRGEDHGGWLVQVAEPRRRLSPASNVCRAALDAHRRVPFDQVILRPFGFKQARSIGEAAAEGQEAALREAPGPPAAGAVAEATSVPCESDLSLFGLDWRRQDIRRDRRPRPQLVGGRPLCQGVVDLVQSGPDGGTIDLLLWNFDIDGAYTKRQHEATLDRLISELHARLVGAGGAPPKAASYTIWLTGFASRTGAAAYNQALANERESAVQAYLEGNLEKFRIDPEKPITPRITFDRNPGGFDPKAPIGRESSHARSVRVIAVPTGRPIPPPRPFPTDAVLRGLLTASMLLTANPAAPFSPGALPSGRQSGSIWAYTLTLNGDVVSANDVTCVIPHPGRRPSPMTVLEGARWEGVEVALAAGRAALPFDSQFLLGSFNASSGAIAARSHPIWRLTSQIDVGTAAVFAYDITDPTNPLPITDVSTLTPSTPGTTPSKLWALVCCELVLCTPRSDFEPAGVLEAARLYPLIEVLTNIDTSTIKGSVTLRRPAISSMDHGWANSGRHLVGLFADRNNNMGIFETMLALVGKSGVAIPTWEDVFDYVLKNAAVTTQSFIVVDPTKRASRSDTSHRQTLDRTHEVNRPSAMLKLPRQGAFDNVHIAPQMEVSLSVPVLGGLPSTAVSMAPICAHDCFHMHWRWSQHYTEEHTLGWGPSGPYTQAGAPMVHPNQTVTLVTTAGVPGLRYEAVAAAQSTMEWMVVMPHGAAYAVRVIVSPTTVLEKLLTRAAVPSVVREAIVSAVAGAEDRAFAWTYFFFQFWPALQSRPLLRPLDILNADLPFLTSL
jgi:outer membrane protein OmpA-like peptidoglycan-associated protein